MQQLELIQQKIYEVRGQKVMLDFDLAELYQVETKVLNQGVKRNLLRFPGDFMFRLTREESNWIITGQMRSQFVTASQRKRNISATPFAFTEHGVAMLASVLRSEHAVQMNIYIVRAFVALRRISLNFQDIAEKLSELRERVDEHDAQLNQICDAIENLLDEKVEAKKWEDRERIGFRK